MMNKKGNFADIPEYLRGALLFGFALTIVILFLSNFNTQIQSMDNDTIPEAAKNASAAMNEHVGPKFDILSPFMLLTFLIISIVAARLIPSSPKFIIIALIAMIALGFVAMILENVWDAWADNATVADAITKMKFTNFIMDHLTAITIIYCMLVGIALFTKTEQTL